jgi:hypothetical protein
VQALINPRTFSSAKGERHEAHFPVPRRSPAYLAGCLSANRRSGWGGAFAGFFCVGGSEMSGGRSKLEELPEDLKGIWRRRYSLM